MDEIWKIHEEYPDYEFSNHGRFRKADTKIILKNTVDDKTRKTVKGGYVITFLKNSKLGIRKRVRVHRIVGFLFVHNPNPLEYDVINHIDGNKTNNHYTNLEWTTVAKNNKHAVLTGLRGPTKLSNDQVRSIRSEYINNADITLNDLADKYSVERELIKSVISYKTMVLVDEEKKDEYLSIANIKLMNEQRKPTVKVHSTEIVNDVMRDYVNGYKKIELIKKYAINQPQINNIIENNELPQITLLANESFKDYKDGYQVSNMCRVKKDGILTVKKTSFVVKAVSDLFMSKPNICNYAQLIDASKPVSIDNIEWCIKNGNGNLMSLQKYEALKEQYTNEKITIENFRIKYLVPNHIMSILKKEVPRDLRPKLDDIRVFKIKPHLCKKCGEDNPQNFIKRSKSLCRKCVSKYVPKPKRPHLCKKCGDNNPDNFKEGNKGCCRKCSYTPKPKKAHLCKKCGDNNPDNFWGSTKGCCKKCQYEKSKNRVGSFLG